MLIINHILVNLMQSDSGKINDKILTHTKPSLTKEKSWTQHLRQPVSRPSDRVQGKNANYAIFAGQIMRLERPIMR